MSVPESRSAMMVGAGAALVVIFLSAGAVTALEPREILVIANKNIAESGRIVRYYCQKRDVPRENILELPLGASLRDTISRGDYEKKLAEPIRKEFLAHERLGKIKCLLTLYGVPIKVGRRGVLAGQEGRLQELKAAVEQEKKKIEQLKQEGLADSEQYKQAADRRAQLQLEIDRISGGETNASLDSELSVARSGTTSQALKRSAFAIRTAANGARPCSKTGSPQR